MDVHSACKQAVQFIKNRVNNGKRYSLQIMVDATAQYYLRLKTEKDAAGSKGNDVHHSYGKRRQRDHGR